MSSPPSQDDIILFHYHRSPYARRVRWYLAFRQIGYKECIQPSIMPRPDLQALGVQYRRTPTMAIGRDVYIDSRMIISRLEQLFPSSLQHPAFSSPATDGLAKLLNKLTIDAGLFSNAVSLFRPDHPSLHNEAFLKDRAGFFGKEWTMQDVVKVRHEGLVHMRECFGIVEALLQDGRKWIGGTEKPTLADLEGVWAIDWVISDLDPPLEHFNETIFPKLYQWRNNFRAELDVQLSKAPKVKTVQGEDAVRSVLGASFTDEDLVVDANDPFNLSEGTNVELYPTDGGGFTHRDSGRLIKLTASEGAIAIQSQQGEVEVHLHAPRWKFRIQAGSQAARL